MTPSLSPVFLAASTDLGVHVDGTARGPRQLLAAISTSAPVIYIDAPVIAKSYDPADHAKNLSGVREFNRSLFHAASRLAADQLPLTLGGDHALTIASGLASLQRHPGLGLIWFDAHTDFHRLDTTLTGNLHGLPLAVLAGHEPALNDLAPGLFFAPSQCVVVGARSVDPPEWDNLRAVGVTVLGMDTIRQRGITAVLTEAFRLADTGHGVHFSFDLDVIDPRLAPGVSVPEADGLDYPDLTQALALLHHHWSRVRSFDLVEYNPDRDRDDRTRQLAAHILRQLSVGD